MNPQSAWGQVASFLGPLANWGGQQANITGQNMGSMAGMIGHNIGDMISPHQLISPAPDHNMPIPHQSLFDQWRNQGKTIDQGGMGVPVKGQQPQLGASMIGENLHPSAFASAPQPIVGGIAGAKASNPFQFQMGQQDYSNMGAQLHQLFQGAPLDQYVPDFIKAGNQYGVDPRVLAIIGQIESSGGKSYPQPGNPVYSQVPNMQDTYNPFGYLVNPTTGHGVEDVYNGARNAGFTSIPMAIDALTSRFARKPTANYAQFYNNPTLENLQAAYNANPKEKNNYLQVANKLLANFQ